MEKYLKNKDVYLSGPIQYSTDILWRDVPKKILSEKFELNIFDPFSDPKQQWVPTLKTAQLEKDYQTLSKVAKSFVRKDLAMVDRADILIAFIKDKVPSVGTVHEIINSNNAKKPTLLVSDAGDKTFIPLWYYGFISPKFMFGSWDELYIYLEEVNDGKHKDNNRWDYVYGLI